MSLVLIEGFDHYDAATTGGKLTLGGGATIGTANGRWGGSSGALMWSTISVGSTYLNLGGNFTALRVGFAYNPGATTTTGNALLAFVAADDVVQLTLRITTSGILYVTRGSTTTIIATGTHTVAPGVWSYIEVYATFLDSGGVVQVHVNDTLDIDYTGDTKYSASYSSAYRLNITYGARYGDTLLDDLYVIDATTAPHQDRLGDCRVDTLYPDTAGSAAEWTPSAGANYACVDERPPDGDTTYVETDVAAERDLYSFEDLAQDTDVYGVAVNVYAKKTDAASRYLRVGTLVGGKEYYSDDLGLSVDYAFHRHVFEQNPYTKADWTRTQLNAAEFGFKYVTDLTTSAPPTTAAPTTV